MAHGTRCRPAQVNAGVRMLIAVSALALGCSRPAVAPLYQVSAEVFRLGARAEQAAPYGPFRRDATDAERFAQLTARFRSRLGAQHTPGGAMAVVLHGRLAFQTGVGVQQVGTTKPVTSSTLFRTASISKMLVAATVLSLAERGLLDLDAAATQFVPYFRRGPGYDAGQVTLAMALRHTAGLPEDPRTCEEAPYALRDYFLAHAGDPLWSPPGSLFNYSNTDYALLAAAIHERTGHAFEDVVRERIFVPAQMQTATYDPPPTAEVAVGHSDLGRALTASTRDCEVSRAAGGVYASVSDFAHFVEMLLARGAGVLTEASVDAMMSHGSVMQSAPRMLYAYGLIETEHRGVRVVMHDGGAFGYRTAVLLAPEHGFGVVVFTNGSANPSETAYAALSAFLMVPEQPPRALASRCGELEPYTGIYRDPSGGLGRVRVFLRGDGLALELLGDQPGPVPGGLRVRFARDQSGVIGYLVTRAGVARREPAAQTPSDGETTCDRSAR